MNRATDIFFRMHPDLVDYDILICTLGYEQRSRYVPLLLRDRSKNRIAIKFDDQRLFSFKENEEILSNLEFAVHDFRSTNIVNLVTNLCDNSNSANDVIRIAIDVSSMSRPCIAGIIYSLYNVGASCVIEIDIYYAPAAFCPPGELDVVTEYSGPVIPEFSGFSMHPEMPTSVVLGLGYELEKALGAIEYLDASHIWCLEPRSDDLRYDTAVSEANESLFDSPNDIDRISYSVSDPIQTYMQLDSLVYDLKKTTRVILLPFGPKLLSAICSLVSASHYPDVTQWRVSGGNNEARDCVAGDIHYSLPITLKPGVHRTNIPVFDQLGGV